MVLNCGYNYMDIAYSNESWNSWNSGKHGKNMFSIRSWRHFSIFLVVAISLNRRRSSSPSSALPKLHRRPWVKWLGKLGAPSAGLNMINNPRYAMFGSCFTNIESLRITRLVKYCIILHTWSTCDHSRDKRFCLLLMMGIIKNIRFLLTLEYWMACCTPFTGSNELFS